MPIPDFQSAMLPVISFLKDGKERHVNEIKDSVAEIFGVTTEEREILLPSGGSKLFSNRVAWAIAHLKMAEVIESPKRSYYRITDSGKKLLKDPPERITLKYLDNFPVFKQKREGWRKEEQDTPENDQETFSSKTPDELIESGYYKIRNELAIELLTKIKTLSPEFFERLVIDLLLKLGYGGSKIDRAEVTGRSGDEGIDGIIKEDKLGLDVIYVQAKRWENSVGSQEIQKFAGALQGQRAKKGIFITTSTFTQPALDFVQKIDSKIILIDGKTLSEFMIDNNVGVSLKNTFEIKKIDTDYFTED
ncbi:MAG: restriction endonuclease [Leptospira sp.]|nr:restriction endonuclease [Leptospira sp.]